MIPGNTPGHYLPDIARYTRPIDGFTAPDIADPLKPSDRPQNFEIPPKPHFDRPIKPKVEAELLLALADPHASFIDISNEFQISLEALSVWMMRPDIAERMETIASASVVRARYVAKTFLPAAARSAGRVLALHQIVRRHNPKSIATNTNNDRRFDKIAMHASALLVKIAKFEDAPAKRATRSAGPSTKSNISPPAPPASSSKPVASQTAPPST
ncbi:MAG: hypothetical protein ACREJD_10280 [Phycisphaerales bacterium]